MKKELHLPEMFLRSFITELIKNTKPSAKESEEDLFEELTEPDIRPMPAGMIPSQFQIKKPLRIVPKGSIPSISTTKPIIPGKIETPITQMEASPKPGSKLSNLPPQKPGVPITRLPPGSPDIGKLNLILADPRVESIECTGPSKNILVRKDGTIQRTNIILTKEEIKKIIDDFSKKTKIPLIGGTFKAAIGSVIMTAVISDFVGSRFIVQKRNPFQALMPVDRKVK